MKTTIKVAVAALVIASFGFAGCKKGPNDPFISLLSRKARMTGEWKTTKGEGKEVNGPTTTTWTYDGAVYSETQTTGSSSTTSTNNITMNTTFEKDGTFKRVTVETQTTPFSYTETITETGTWNFTGKIGEDKNKDHVVMKTLSTSSVYVAGSSTVSSSTSYTGDDAPTMLYFLDQLKNKEIIMTYEGTTTSGSTTTSNEGAWTMTQE
jgi:hypothetical protein